MHPRLQETAGLARLVRIRPLTFDDLASARAIHMAAFKFSTRALMPDEDLDAALQRLASIEYTDRLAATSLIGGFMDDSLVATAGWSAADDHGAAARISAVAVLPLFTSIGIGRRMVAEAESHARLSGYGRLHVRAQLHAIPFFLRIGYDIVQQGLRPIGHEPLLPVAAMRKDLPQIVG